MTSTTVAEGGALVHAVRRTIVRTGQGPLRAVWRPLYALLIRAIIAYLRPGRAGAVYLQGSFAEEEPVYGVSDVDVVIVLPGAAAPADRERALVQERWAKLCRAIPWLPRLAYVTAYDERELADAAGATVLTHGLAGPPGDAALRTLFTAGPGLRPKLSLRLRPGPYGPTEDWRLVAGPDRRPRNRGWDREDQLVAAWLELQFWWQHALLACSRQPGPWPHHPYLCVKLVAEPARIWLWLARGERVRGRREVLVRTLAALPEEEATLRFGLALYEKLSSNPEPPLARALEGLLSLTRRVAGLVAGELEQYGVTRIRLTGAEGELLLPAEAAETVRAPGLHGRLVPLADWRARAVPAPLDHALALSDREPSNPETLGAAARAERPGIAPAFTAGDLLVLPAAGSGRPLSAATLRGIQFPGSDPVSFALIAGRDHAAFPSIRGWSAVDSGARAVAEYAAWLATSADGVQAEQELGTLFGAARAALYMESLGTEEPLLPLSVAAVADHLRERSPAEATLVEEAHQAYRLSRLEGSGPPAAALAAFRQLTRALAPYAGD